MSEELSPSTGARLVVCYRTGEMSGKEGENFRPRVCGGRFTILEPMTETTHARRQFWVVEGMVGARVDHEIEDGTAISGPCHHFAAIAAGVQSSSAPIRIIVGEVTIAERSLHHG
jgi:hypothetical protein